MRFLNNKYKLAFILAECLTHGKKSATNQGTRNLVEVFGGMTSSVSIRWDSSKGRIFEAPFVGRAEIVIRDSKLCNRISDSWRLLWEFGFHNFQLGPLMEAKLEKKLNRNQMRQCLVDNYGE